MKRIGKDIPADRRWRERGPLYAAGIDAPYHRHRRAVIDALLPDMRGQTVLDFGCGEGVLIRAAAARGAARVIGIDIDEHLLGLAAESGADELVHGGVDRLASIGSVDGVIAANVAAYFTDDEDRRFYEHVARLLCPGGWLVITHSNELFDLYTLNAYTVEFFARNFGAEVSGLLAHPDEPNRVTFNVRENPLAYAAKLEGYGMEVEQMEFINLHEQPPLLTSLDPDDLDARAYPDTLTAQPRWRLMFQCSMFGVRARRA